MFTIQGNLVIERPVEEVFDFAVDERNEPTYNPRMLVAEVTTDGPIGVGTQFHSSIMSAGKLLSMDGEITAYERPNRYALRVHMSVMDIEGSVSFVHISEGTLMRWAWEVEPQGVLKLMEFAMAPIGRRQERAIWMGLKRVLEARNEVAA